MEAKRFIDPVCGMQVEPETAAGRSEHEGTTYFFCANSCKQKFDRDPKRYLNIAPGPHLHTIGPPPKPVEGAKYTCPMHPEIVRDAPGSCPICGMALEPMVATHEEGPNPELVEMRRRFRVCLVLSLPLLAVAM